MNWTFICFSYFDLTKNGVVERHLTQYQPSMFYKCPSMFYKCPRKRNICRHSIYSLPFNYPQFLPSVLTLRSYRSCRAYHPYPAFLPDVPTRHSYPTFPYRHSYRPFLPSVPTRHSLTSPFLPIGTYRPSISTLCAHTSTLCAPYQGSLPNLFLPREKSDRYPQVNTTPLQLRQFFSPPLTIRVQLCKHR